VGLDSISLSVTLSGNDEVPSYQGTNTKLLKNEDMFWKSLLSLGLNNIILASSIIVLTYLHLIYFMDFDV
jgi:hypothetical protein